MVAARFRASALEERSGVNCREKSSLEAGDVGEIREAVGEEDEELPPGQALTVAEVVGELSREVGIIWESASPEEEASTEATE